VSGELAAGERVPSTRAITREWGVAIATASRVLAALQADGLVRAVPGVGTVVVDRTTRPPGPTRPTPERATGRGARAENDPPWARSPAPSTVGPLPEEALTAERIVAAAVAVADAEGLAGVSMRRIAAGLGVVPMALYRYVSDKDDLLLRMLDAGLREWRPPVDPPAGWRPRVEAAARALWATFRRHPWLAQALSVTRPQPTAAGMAYSEWVVDALHGHGMSLVEAFDVHLMLINYVRGTAIGLESEREAEATSGLDNDGWMAAQEPALLAVVASERFPQLRRMFAEQYDLDVDALFDRGLRLLLDGLALQMDRTVEAGRSAAPPWSR
jgi:AcrR family transcriptional regulator